MTAMCRGRYPRNNTSYEPVSVIGTFVNRQVDFFKSFELFEE